MKKQFLAIGLIATTILFTSCGQTKGNKIEETGTKTEDNKSTKEQPKQGPSFKQGEEVKLGDFIIKVNKVTDFKSDNDFMKPKEGMKLVAVEVEYNNPTTDKQLNANPMDWTAFDNEGYSSDFGMTESKEPALHASTLNPGGKVKGWVTFEITKTNKLTKVQFKPGFLGNSNVEFVLQ